MRAQLHSDSPTASRRGRPLLAPLYFCEIDSPLGALLLAGDGRSLRHVHFQGGPRPMRPPNHWIEDPAPLAAVATQLDEYFAGERRVFRLPLAPVGSAFQLAVWQALTQLAYGSVVSYAELARRIGRPGACRAVGLANGANPLPILIPCHRVIGADGSLTGFGGGLDIKRRLLALERRVAPDRLVLTPSPSAPG